MFAKSPILAELDKEILAALKELDNHESTSEEYGMIVERIAKLYKLKSEEEFQPPSMDTTLVVIANLLGIFWMTRYEKSGEFISSKALSFVMKPKA